MNKLNKLKLLIEEINKNPLFKRFKELETIIDNNEKIQEDYQIMLEKQKKMVNAETFKRANYQELKEDYESHRETLYGNMLIEEYLDLQVKINDDLQLIQEIITSEINKELE